MQLLSVKTVACLSFVLTDERHHLTKAIFKTKASDGVASRVKMGLFKNNVDYAGLSAVFVIHAASEPHLRHFFINQGLPTNNLFLVYSR